MPREIAYKGFLCQLIINSIMDKSREKIELFHFKEIQYMLLILASNLYEFKREDLLSFSEAIENISNDFLDRSFLESLGLKYGINNKEVEELIKIKQLVTNLIRNKWFNSLQKNEALLKKANNLAHKLLRKLKVRIENPKEFEKRELNIEW